jgi:hypothetical protein
MFVTPQFFAWSIWSVFKAKSDTLEAEWILTWLASNMFGSKDPAILNTSIRNDLFMPVLVCYKVKKRFFNFCMLCENVCIFCFGAKL